MKKKYPSSFQKMKQGNRNHCKRAMVIFFFIQYSIFNIQYSIGSDNTPLGSRSAGIGNASVSLADVWAAQNNQAGLAFVKNISAGIVYHNQFLLKELGTRAFALALPAKRGTFGVVVSDFGYSLYSENKYGLAFGKSFGKNFSGGVQMDLITVKISEYGSKNVLAAEAGLQTKPLKNLTIGIHIFNLTKSKLADYNDERIPTIMRLGFDYKFSDKVFFALESEKDIERNAMAKAGIEYQVIKDFFLRTGISTNPTLNSFGIGIHLKQFQLDLSSTYHSTLGFSPQVGFIYEFEKPIKKNPMMQ